MGAGHGFPLAAVVGVRLAFEPGRDATAVPVRSAITGIAMSLAAVIAALIFGSSLARLIQDPAVTGCDWAVAVGNPHSGDTSAQIEPRLRADADVTGYTATSLGDGGWTAGTSQSSDSGPFAGTWYLRYWLACCHGPRRDRAERR